MAEFFRKKREDKLKGAQSEADLKKQMEEIEKVRRIPAARGPGCCRFDRAPRPLPNAAIYVLPLLPHMVQSAFEGDALRGAWRRIGHVS